MTTDNPIPRPSGRVVLIDEQDRVLLFRGFAAAAGPRTLWFTPGGALEPGETFEQAALRELWEETGIDDVALGPCVWVRRFVFSWEDVHYDSDERFFPARVTGVTVRDDNWEDVERRYIVEHRWWTVDAIAASSDQFVPRALARLLPPILAGDYPPAPLETGE